MKKIDILILLNIGFAVIFSVLNICFAADISCLAFLLSAAYTAFVVYFVGYLFSKKGEYKRLFCCRKIIQYESFVFLISFILRRAGLKGTSFWFDVLSVVCWIFVFVSSEILSYSFDFKHFKKISGIEVAPVKNESLGKMFAKGKTKDGSKVTGLSYVKWFCFELLDWADALLQAVFLVLLFQIFFFQFYKIPTESMVPEYMVNDRVAVSKITSGPKFPLTDVGLPCFKNYKRGDIVVFRNPHYTIDRQSEVKSVVSQLLYMFTFTFVNTNVDENGNLKADPLVKRITGIPGEQLMIQDGILYSRTKDSYDFKVVSEDATWAVYNQNTEREAVKKMIREFPVSTEIFEQFEALESYRKSFDIYEMAQECKKVALEFSSLSENRGLSKEFSDNELLNLFGTDGLSIDSIWSESRNGTSELSMKFINTLFSSPARVAWFNAFMTDWINHYDGVIRDGYVGGSLYDDSSFRLNLMYKYYVGSLLLETYKNIINGVPNKEWRMSDNVQQYEANLHMLYYYMYFMDLRNMPVFPANDENGMPQYIPENCYFMMGDNRFNSLDMRHCEVPYLAKITSYDNYSLEYVSFMKPQYVPKKLILGSTGLRIWPLVRPERASKTN